MVVGLIRQAIRVKTLPAGWQMSITDVRLNNISGGWWPGFTHDKVAMYKNNIDTARAKMPLELKYERHSQIWELAKFGEALFTSQNTRDSGKGPDITVDFQLQGSDTEEDGKTAKFKANGSVHISTSDWNWWSRADNVYVKYSLNGGSQHVVTNTVPVRSETSEVELLVGWDLKRKVLGLNGSNDGGLLGGMCQEIEKGNLVENGAMAGWSLVTL